MRKWVFFLGERGRGSFELGVRPSSDEVSDLEVCLKLLLGHSEPGR